MEIKEIRRKNLIALIEYYLVNKIYPSQGAIAEKVGIANSYLSQMIMEPGSKGSRGVSEDKARQIESALILSTNYLDDKLTFESLTGSAILDDVNMVLIPYLDVEHLYGVTGLKVDDDLKSGMAFHHLMLSPLKVSGQLNELAILKNTSLSMKPSINQDDIVLLDLRVNSFEQIESRNVYAFVANQELHVKRLIKNVTGDLRIVSDNVDKTQFPDEIVKKSDLSAIQLCGQVIWRSGVI